MKKNTYPGKFIVFEGLDGSGQSTQAELLKDFLGKKGFQVILTKEPTRESQASRELRQALDKNIKLSPKSLQELFVQDRREHLEKLIVPALQAGKIVISDRYFFSTFAFGVSDGLDLSDLIKMNDEFLVPDLTIILKVRPEVCSTRIDKRGSTRTLFEETEKLRKVWQTYQILPDRIENVYIIEGEKSIKEVSQQVQELVHSQLNI